MGYSSKKTIQRNAISGIFEANDGADKNGTANVNELRARMDARQTAVNEAIQKDWKNPNGMDSPAYGNAVAEFNRTRSK
jgi:hypothetical protein